MGLKRRNTNEPAMDPNIWMLTFSDLVMLLLTFFVLLLTMSSMDTKQLKDMFTHFTGSSGVLELAGSREIVAFNEFIDKFRTADSLVVVDQKAIKELFLPKNEMGREVQKVVDDIQNAFQLTDDERGIVLSFKDEVFFDPGKSQIKIESFTMLEKIAETISASPNQILIEGHTDGLPLKSSVFGSNWELSVRRGLAVLSYFLKVKNLPPARFAVGGYGSSRPVGSNDTPEGRSENRRVEIIFRHPRQEVQ